MKKKAPPLIELAIIAYCAWQSSDLYQDWFSTPFLRWGWLAFLIWILPVFAYWFIPAIKEKSTTIYFSGIGLAITLIGSLADIHAIQHVGFAFAIASLIPYSWKIFFWLALSATWMPSLAYFARGFSIELVIIARLILAILGTGWILVNVQQKLTQDKEVT